MRSHRSVRSRALLLSLVLSSSSQAATITVNSISNNVADDGLCTLHEALVAANTDTASGPTEGECAAGNGADVIEFKEGGTIQPVVQLPTITTVVHIDGYTADGASRNTLPLEQGTNAVLAVEIDGVNAGNVPGLYLSGAGAAGSIIEGLAIGNSGNPACCNTDAILMEGVSGAVPTIIRGNFLGTDLSGTQRRPKGSRAMFLRYDSSNVVIGSDLAGDVDPAAVNLLSGNNSAAIVPAGVTDLRIRGNLIGTDASGTAILYNGASNFFTDSVAKMTIRENVIAGSNGAGVHLRAVSSDIVIERNRIGTNAAGSSALPNSSGGILVAENPNTSPTSISDVDVVENLVAYNNCNGCSGGIVVGVNNAANTTQRVRLFGNRVFANQGLEIDLAPPNMTNNGLVYGITANDVDDLDEGPNGLQNFPELSVAKLDGLDLTLDYSLNGQANRDLILEFFHTGSCDASGHGGGEVFLGMAEASTDGAGNLAGEITLAVPGLGGFVTATATDKEVGTSEFSLCLAVGNLIFKDGYESS